MNAVLGRRDVVLVGDWDERTSHFEREPIYLVRGGVIDALLPCEDLVDEHFGTVDVVPGSTLAATATVLNKVS